MARSESGAAAGRILKEDGFRRHLQDDKETLVDPVRYKKILILLLKLLVVFELISAISGGMQNGQWGRFGFDLIVAGLLYVMWERVTLLLRTQKEEYRKRMESAPQHVRLWDALIFSLLWSDKIYADIPVDRRRLVVISYTLIALGLVAAFLSVGSGLMPLVISGALVMGAVNLVIWVVAAEREARESLQTELRLAHDVQMSLMPKEHPQLPGYDIAGLSLPAREVGGDLFDYACVGEDGRKLAIAIFDVSGKGMEAAMSAVFTSGAFASEARRSSSPAEILTRLNRAVTAHSRKGHFVAFLLGVLDVERRTLVFANAGQSRPLLMSGGEVRSLDAVGVHFPLGMQEESAYEERCIPLAPGDRLLFLTDGITDAMNSARDLFGQERLEALLRDPETASLPATALLERITDEVRQHAGQAPQHDDMTLVALKVA